MTRFSVQLPDSLDTWLQAQADENSRTKNGQLVYLLELAQRKQPRRVGLLVGFRLPCSTCWHYWPSDTPAEDEACNCGKVKW